MSGQMDFMPTAVVAFASVSYAIVGADKNSREYPENLAWIDMSNVSFFDDEEFDDNSIDKMNNNYCLDPKNCDYTPMSLLLAALSFYMAISAINNLLEAYRFLTVWNMIVQTRQMDMISSCKWKRKAYETLPTVNVNSMCHHHNCPVCLSDFFEGDFVTACEEGCGSWFHKECLFEWLDRKETCPCCRKDMITNSRRGWQIPSFLGCTTVR